MTGPLVNTRDLKPGDRITVQIEGVVDPVPAWDTGSGLWVRLTLKFTGKPTASAMQALEPHIQGLYDGLDDGGV